MSSAPRKLMAVAAGVAVLFAAGLTQLLLLRFEAGDVYPAYSSLRTDPLGTRVLYESLNRLEQDTASRNFRPPDQVLLTPQTTLLVCGLGANGFFLGSKKIRALVDQVAVSGGRLVLTLSTRLHKRSQEPEEAEEPQDGEDSETPEPDAEPNAEPDVPSPDEWLGTASLGFDFRQARNEEMDDTAFRSDPGSDGLPAMIPWRTDLYFDLEDPAWQTLYTWQDEPVVVQRSWGRGTVLMAADSYLFSNEALRNHRYAGLLTWLLGPGRTVIFDEFHHGLADQPGIAALARKYRLQGVFGALIVVAILFIWRETAVFVPPVRAESGSASIASAAGRDTSEGLVDLARQHIQSRELLNVCFDAWQSHSAKRVPDNLVARIQSLIQQASADPLRDNPVHIYRRICELLKQGRRI